MVRRKPKVKEEPEQVFDWPFAISINLTKFKPKVAFLSGCERGYYPDDPGHSRFSLAYCLPDPDDTAVCEFTPSTNLLDKPVSNLGYGMGGLLAPRFPRLTGEDTPAPNTYQTSIIPQRIQEKKVMKKTKWSEFVQMYERIVEQQCARYEQERSLIESMAQQGMRKSNVDPGPQQKKKASISNSKFKGKSEINAVDRLCQRSTAAFGMCLTRPRFEREEKSSIAGPGTYNLKQSFLKRSFQITTPEGKLVPRVRLVCLPQSFDTCMRCGLELVLQDYYQTKGKFRVVNKVDTVTYGKFKSTHLSLCKSCYCHALKHGHGPWRKDRVPFLFVKARHCNSVHDHQEGFEEFVNRSTCKSQTSLARKEILYSRFYKDTPCVKPN